MSDLTGIGDLAAMVREIKQVSSTLTQSDAKLGNRVEAIETNLNRLLAQRGRPGAEFTTTSDKEVAERRDAIGLLQLRAEEQGVRPDPDAPLPGEDAIAEALTYRRAITRVLNGDKIDTLSPDFRRSLSAFSFGGSGMLLPPEMVATAISCIVDPSDLSQLFTVRTTSSPSVRFPIDNARMAVGGWACEADCFANNPMADLREGLGTLEIKPETIRFVTCATEDFIEDLNVDAHSWVLDKVSLGMRATINNALITGDGIGKPLGVLNPAAGIPICETSAATPAGQISWQDLVQLAYELPVDWHNDQGGASFLMNQRTFAKLMTMSDAVGRPLMESAQGVQGALRYSIAGFPVHVATQMPDVAPGATPVAFGAWKRVYCVIWRRQVTMTVDPYTAGYCTMFKFSAKVGGGILCGNAARLLRVR